MDFEQRARDFCTPWDFKKETFQLLFAYLENFALVVFPQVISKNVSVHQSSSALAQNVHGLFQELNFDPGHVMLLHLVHFLLDHGVQLVFKLQRLQVVHVAIAIMKVSIQGCPGFLLALTCSFGVVFIVPIAVIPGASMRLPGAKTNPAKISFAGLVLANHVITTSVLFDDRPAFGTLFGVGGYPIGSLGVVVAFLNPFLD